VVAVVDADRRRAEALAARLSGSQALDEADEVFSQVEAVHICTPSATHVRYITRAIEAGRHVLVEKPLAPDATRAAALLDLAARRNVCLCPVHQFLFQDGVRDALARLPAMGPLRHVSFTICSAGGGTSALERDRVALEILPHPLSLIARLMPGADAIEWSTRRPSAGEIRALAQVGEVTISLLISMNGRPTVNRVELIGANGTTSVDLFHGFAVTHGGRVSRLRKAARPFTAAGATAMTAAGNLARRAWRREPAYPGLRRLVLLFYGAVRGNGNCPIPPDETLTVAREGDRLCRLLGLEAIGL